MTGILLALLGGLLVGNCMAPLKRIRVWAWECTWLVFSVASLILVPWLIALAVIPGWPGIYSSLTTAMWLPSLLLGFGWGIAQVLFGISVVRLGMSLAFTIVIGLGTVFGTLVPLMTQHRGELFSTKSMILIAGCGLMAFGVSLSGVAGSLREKSAAEEAGGSKYGSGYVSGLMIAVLSGVLSSMLNLSLAFGEPIAQLAIEHGAAQANAPFAVWPVAFAGGLIPNLAYTLWLLVKNRSWGLLTRRWQDGGWSLLMGSLWIGAVAIYGISTRYLGTLGVSAGWAIFEITMVLTANAAGLLLGEWKRAPRRAVGILAGGVVVLVLATITTAISTR